METRDIKIIVWSVIVLFAGITATLAYQGIFEGDSDVPALDIYGLFVVFSGILAISTNYIWLDWKDSVWSKPKDKNLKKAGYRINNRVCRNRDLAQIVASTFIIIGGSKELLLKCLDPTKLSSEEKLQRLAICGGFPDIKDWFTLPIETRRKI